MDHISTLPPLLKEHETAEILNVEVAPLRRWRWSGKPPCFIKIGAAVRYDIEDIRAFIEERRRKSTSDQGTEVVAHESA